MFTFVAYLVREKLTSLVDSPGPMVTSEEGQKLAKETWKEICEICKGQ